MALNSFVKFAKVKKKRKGIHAKTKASRNKNSKTYLKRYRGQGH